MSSPAEQGEMTPLGTELRVQNRTLKQIKRQGQAALYELYGAQGMLYGFELIIIRVRKAEEAFGKSYPEREVFPPSESWGTLGWSYGRNHRKEALEAFDTLCAKLSNTPPMHDLCN